MILEILGEVALEAGKHLTAPLRRAYVAYAKRTSPVVPMIVIWSAMLASIIVAAMHLETWWGIATMLTTLPVTLIVTITWVHARAGDYDGLPRAKRYRRVRVGDPDAG